MKSATKKGGEQSSPSNNSVYDDIDATRIIMEAERGQIVSSPSLRPRSLTNLVAPLIEPLGKILPPDKSGAADIVARQLLAAARHAHLFHIDRQRIRNDKVLGDWFLDHDHRAKIVFQESEKIGRKYNRDRGAREAAKWWTDDLPPRLQNRRDSRPQQPNRRKAIEPKKQTRPTTSALRRLKSFIGAALIAALAHQLGRDLKFSNHEGRLSGPDLRVLRLAHSIYCSTAPLRFAGAALSEKQFVSLIRKARISTKAKK